MKRLKPNDRKRWTAMCLALNWYLSDLEDTQRAEEYERELADPSAVTYSQAEVELHFAMRYVCRFRTKRLRKKHADVVQLLRAGSSGGLER